MIYIKIIVATSMLFLLLSMSTGHASSSTLHHFIVADEPPQACYKEGVRLFNEGRYWMATNIWEETLAIHKDKLNLQQRKGLRMRIAGAFKELNSNPAANTTEAKGRRNYDKGCRTFAKAIDLLKKGDNKIEATQLFENTFFYLKQARQSRRRI